MPSDRRSLLRRAGTGVALGAGVGLAGCTTVLPAWSRSSGGGERFADPDGALTAGEFVTYAARSRDRYGENGVWGVDATPSLPDFLGAWTGSHLTGRGGSAGDDGGEDGESDGDDSGDGNDSGGGLATAEFAVAAYDLGTHGEDDERFFEYWLWAAGRPTPDPAEANVSSAKLRGLGVHLWLPDPDELQMYGPAGDRREEGLVSVSLLGPGGNGVGGRFPLHGGTVSPGRPKTWGDADAEAGMGADAYAVGWEGELGRPQSVNAVVLSRRPADAPTGPLPFRWSYHVAAAGYL